MTDEMEEDKRKNNVSILDVLRERGVIIERWEGSKSYEGI